MVHFKTDVFKNFIPKCPLLERLPFKSCYNLGSIHIDIPHLKFFYFLVFSSPIRFSKTSRHLSTVIFDGYRVGHPYTPTKFLERAPVIEHLRLGSGHVDYLLYGTVWRNVSLGCLKVLELPLISFELISSVLNLIVRSPNLEKLDIGFATCMAVIQPLAPELLKVQDLSSNALKKLRVVKMKLSRSEEVKPDLEFIKFILAESRVLEKMFIQPPSGTVAEDGQKILKEITRFQRSSKKAEILYLDP